MHNNLDASTSLSCLVARRSPYSWTSICFLQDTRSPSKSRVLGQFPISQYVQSEFHAMPSREGKLVTTARKATWFGPEGRLRARYRYLQPHVRTSNAKRAPVCDLF